MYLNIFKIIIGYSFWLFLTTIVDKINWSADQFILGVVNGTIAVSLYSAASTINQLFLSLSTAISSVLLPKVSKMIAKNANSNEITNEFIKVGRIQYYLIFLMGSGLVLFGQKFIILWLGDEFKEAYYIALVLVIPVCFPLIQNLGLSIMQAMNKFKFKSISTFIMSLFNIIISIFLAKKYGPLGAAIGTAIALIICNIIIINIYYYKVIRINVLKFWKEIFVLTIKFIPSILIIILLMKFLTLDGWLYLIIYGLIYSMIFLVISYLMCMNDYEKGIINKIFMKVCGVRK